MDPISAVGIAAAVLQFVEFGASLLSETYRVYRSPSGRTANEVTLSAIASDLSVMMAEIKNMTEVGNSYRSPALNQLLQLCKDCEQMVLPLQEAIKGMQIDGEQSFGYLQSTTGDRRTLRSSFRIALAAVWGEKGIEETITALREMRTRMIDSVIFCLWYAAPVDVNVESSHDD
jgi:hypothetical protein